MTKHDKEKGGCQYGITEKPAWQHCNGEECHTKDAANGLFWSGGHELPNIGDRVDINLHGYGRGTVESFYVESDWIGIEVHAERVPPGHNERAKKHGIKANNVLVYGCDITPVSETYWVYTVFHKAPKGTEFKVQGDEITFTAALRAAEETAKGLDVTKVTLEMKKEEN